MKSMTKKAAKVVGEGLKKVLWIEANTTSSFMSFQPKAPEGLKKFRSTK